MWRIPVLRVKILKSLPVKTEPLSDYITPGNPCVPKVPLSFSIVVSVAAELRQWKSNHLEWASTTRRNIFPMKGAEKSMCVRVLGRFGHSQGCRVAGGVVFQCALYTWQLFTFFSNAESIFGHQTGFLAIPFILTMPG